MLVHDGRLAGIIDWGYLSYADSALDLIPAWAILDPQARGCSVALQPDEATWLRAKANALEQALGGVVHYVPRGHQLGDVMLATLGRLLADDP